MIKYFKYLKFLLIYFIILNFSSHSYSQKITFKNGVKYIENKKPIKSNNLKIELQYIRVYGGLEATTEEAVLYNPVGVVLDKKNNLFILDRNEPHVKIYDSTGIFLRKFGKTGQGPGEFLRPIGIDINDRNQPYISDLLANAIFVVSSKGDYIRKIYPEFNIRFPIPVFKIKKNGNFLAGTGPTTTYLPPGYQYHEPIMKLYDQNGKFLRGFGEIEYFEDQAVCKMGNYVHFCLDNDENIYVAYHYQNRIEKYSSQGKLLMNIKRKLPYKMSKNAKFILKIRPNGIVSGSRAPIMNTFSFGIGVDNKSRIWVLTFSRQPKYRSPSVIAEGEKNYVKFEIFNRDGVLIQELPIDKNLAPRRNCLYIKKNKLFIINQNDASITEYRIIN